jgi:clan AA aspartic protease
MGVTYIQGTVSNNGHSAEVEFLVDSGAKYTLLPLDTWKALGLEPIRSMRFRLADGTPIERSLSECRITLPPHGTLHTPVLLGESNDRALLGAVTLEEFALVLDPFKGTLYQATLLPL